MGIVVALDVHRKQVTYKALDRETGEVKRGRIAPAARADVREWLARFAGCEAEFVLEGTTGWRFVGEEIERAGHRAHLADPAETAAKRGRKRRSKTDSADCAAEAAVRGRAAGVVDPARAHPRAAHARADAQDVDRSAHRLAAAAAGATLPPGCAGRLEAAHPPRTRGARPSGALACWPRVGGAGAADDRHDRPRACRARPGLALVRSSPAGLSCADRQPLRRWCDQCDRDPRRAR